MRGRNLHQHEYARPAAIVKDVGAATDQEELSGVDSIRQISPSMHPVRGQHTFRPIPRPIECIVVKAWGAERVFPVVQPILSRQSRVLSH
jgi:hypothetical protein